MIYQVKKGYITQREDDNIIIFDPEESTIFTLNKSAAFIFDLIKKGAIKKEIISKVAKRYNIKLSQAQADLEEYLDTLIKNKIIQISK